MFKPLGLFDTAQCPDKTCRRPYCLFQHGESSRSSTGATRQAATIASITKDSPARKRSVEGEGLSESGIKRVKTEDGMGSGASSTPRTTAKPSDMQRAPGISIVNGGKGEATVASRSDTPPKPVLEQSKAKSSASAAAQKASLMMDRIGGVSNEFSPSRPQCPWLLSLVVSLACQ